MAKTIAQYLTQILTESKQNPEQIANYIAAFYQKPRNEELYE
ncbi:hypothetical protein PN466_24360 [Roseofilum reptotaenium CS-1145]|nr:hypothetical protein [Roseofilum reptotaenium]MDB9520084.1 hypothetical protein [Roseofilum reptotaenium CS-1145]